MIHPLYNLTALFVLPTLLVGFTSAQSFFRSKNLPIVTIMLWLCLTGCTPFMVRMPWDSMLGGQAGSFFYQYLDVALISQFDYESDGPTKTYGARRGKVIEKRREAGWKMRRGSALRRLQFGWQAMTNWRGVGESYAVHNLPTFSTSDPSYIPNRSRFLFATRYVYLGPALINTVRMRYFEHAIPFLLRYQQQS